MNLKKKSIALCAVVVGAAVFTTSAFADALIGSGYSGLKDSVKSTAGQLISKVDSYTAEADMNLKVDGTEYASLHSFLQVDNKNQAKISVNTQKEGGEESSYYSYDDPSQSIHKGSDGIYYVYENNYADESSSAPENPFEDEQVQDMEKILDALVGNLKDVVQVEEKDGQKMYIANLTDTQVPPLVNAVSAFVVKYGLLTDYQAKQWGMPALKSDIFVKDASGKAIQNADGLLEDVVVSGSVTGKDENGGEHLVTLDVTMHLTDVNNTAVTAPDLSGQQVERVAASEREKFYGITEKYVGTYQAPIVENTADAITKIGESTLVITSIDGDTVTGTYTETYLPGYENEEAVEISFIGTNDEERYDTVITYTQNGEEKQGVISPCGRNDAGIRITLDCEIYEDGGYSSRGDTQELSRVFE